MTERELRRLKVYQLKEKCRENELKVGGNKEDIIERLIKFEEGRLQQEEFIKNQKRLFHNYIEAKVSFTKCRILYVDKKIRNINKYCYDVWMVIGVNHVKDNEYERIFQLCYTANTMEAAQSIIDNFYQINGTTTGLYISFYDAPMYFASQNEDDNKFLCRPVIFCRNYPYHCHAPKIECHDISLEQEKTPSAI